MFGYILWGYSLTFRPKYMVGTSNQSVPESWPLIKYYIQLLAPCQSTVQDHLLDLLLDIPLPTANHGAEFYIPTFTSILWPSDVGKYSSTMLRIWVERWMGSSNWGFTHRRFGAETFTLIGKIQSTTHQHIWGMFLFSKQYTYWLVVSILLKNMKVRLDHHPNYWEK